MQEDQATLSFLGFLINSWFLWGTPAVNTTLPPQRQAALASALDKGQRAYGVDWDKLALPGLF